MTFECAGCADLETASGLREFKTKAALVAHERHAHGIVGARAEREPENAEELFAPSERPPAPARSSPAQDEPAPRDEEAPRRPKFMDRLRSRRGRGRGGQGPTPVPGERAPRAKRSIGGRRIPLDDTISDVWAFGGRRLEASPHYATGRMLQYQAPAAGVILDRALAGTLPDRVLFQPIARNRGKYEDVGFLLAGPLLTFSITVTMNQMQAAIDRDDHEAYAGLVAKLEMQREMFTWALSMMLPRLAAGAKAAEDRKAKRDKAIAEAFPELGDQDPAEMLAQMLFAPPTFTPPSEESNGRADYDSAARASEGSVPFGS